MADIIQNKDLNKTGLAQPSQVNRLKPLGGPTSSGQFNNLSKVIGANQNNKLGSAIAGNVQGIAEKTKQDANQAFQGFQTHAQQNKLDTDQNIQKRQEVIGRYGMDNQNVQGPTDEETATFDKFRAGQYQGPIAVDKEEDLRAQADAVGGLRQGFNTEQGRIGVLQRFLGNRGYTAGQKRLDATLLGGANSAQVRGGLQGAISNASDAQKQLNAANLIGQDLTERAKAFGADTTAAIQGTRSANESALDARITQGEADKAARIQRIKDSISKGTGDVQLSEADLKDLGVTEGQGVLGNFTDALNVAGTKATRQNVAKENEYQKFQALSKLAGMNESQYTDPNQAESFYKNQIKLDSDTSNQMMQEAMRKAQADTSAESARQQYVDAMRERRQRSGDASYGNYLNEKVLPSLQRQYNEALAQYGLRGDLDQAYGNLSSDDDFSYGDRSKYESIRNDPTQLMQLAALRRFTKAN